MKPVLILQRASSAGLTSSGDPAATGRRRLRFAPYRADDTYPSDVQGHWASAGQGAYTSTNDDLPSLRRAQALIRDVIQKTARRSGTAQAYG
jgi:hypothetical protein